MSANQQGMEDGFAYLFSDDDSVCEITEVAPKKRKREIQQLKPKKETQQNLTDEELTNVLDGLCLATNTIHVSLKKLTTKWLCAGCKLYRPYNMMTFPCQRHLGCISCIVGQLNKSRSFVVDEDEVEVMKLHIRCFECEDDVDVCESLKPLQFESESNVLLKIQLYCELVVGQHMVKQKAGEPTHEPEQFLAMKICPFCQKSSFADMKTQQRHMRLCAAEQFKCGYVSDNGNECEEIFTKCKLTNNRSATLN